MVLVKFNNNEEMISVSFDKNDNIITLIGNNVPEVSTGFCTYSSFYEMIGDFSEFNTVYRVLEDGVQFSNDGSVWVEPLEPTRDITVQVVWNDNNNIEELRPAEVHAIINGENIVFSEDNNWQKTYNEVKESETVVIESADIIDKYDMTINGTNITYFHEYINPAPSLEERVSDLEMAVYEIANTFMV